MKKKIGNKTYDTTTAERLFEWDNGLSVLDYGFFSETLYRTKDGEYFLHGQGEGMTHYAGTGGGNIVLTTEAEAMRWLGRCGGLIELEQMGRYDRKTAQELYQWSNGVPCMEVDYLCETLYCTKDGEFFIYGRGGEKTEYSSFHDERRYRGRMFIPVTADEAMDWLKQHGAIDVLAQHFPEYNEGETGEA